MLCIASYLGNEWHHNYLLHLTDKQAMIYKSHCFWVTGCVMPQGKWTSHTMSKMINYTFSPTLFFYFQTLFSNKFLQDLLRNFRKCENTALGPSGNVNHSRKVKIAGTILMILISELFWNHLFIHCFRNISRMNVRFWGIRSSML